MIHSNPRFVFLHGARRQSLAFRSVPAVLAVAWLCACDQTEPNRPPEAVGAMEAVELTGGDSASWSLSQYFNDPDNQELTYIAGSTAPEVARPSISGDLLTVLAGLPGAATITVTATDPEGLTATQQLGVTVTRGLLFREDFDSTTALNGWQTADGYAAALSEGMMRITRIDTIWHSDIDGVHRRLGAVDWDVSASIGNISDNGWVRLVVTVDDPGGNYHGHLLEIGERPFGRNSDMTNFRFFDIHETADGYWLTFNDDMYGYSNAISGLGELTELRISSRGDSILSVTTGSTVLFSELTEGGYRTPAMSGVMLSIGTDRGNEGGQVAVTDWIEVVGALPAHPDRDRPGPRSASDPVRPAATRPDTLHETGKDTMD